MIPYFLILFKVLGLEISWDTLKLNKSKLSYRLYDYLDRGIHVYDLYDELPEMNYHYF